jgi:subtilase family serine protease
MVVSKRRATMVVDPENELEEYNEDNNVASKEIVY